MLGRLHAAAEGADTTHHAKGRISTEIANVLNPILLEVQLRRDWDVDIGVELLTELVLLVEKLKMAPRHVIVARLRSPR